MALATKAWTVVQYPFIDVWNGRAALAWEVFSEDGRSSHVERFSGDEQARLGITEELLRGAIKEVCGAGHRSGHYPISEAIWTKLAEAEEIRRQ
jgi:hypothetical protein